MSDEASNAAPDVTPQAPLVEAPVATGGHTALGHALYIFGTVAIVTAAIAGVVTVHNVMKPKPKQAAVTMPAAVIVHEPAPVKEQDRVIVSLPAAIEPEVPAVPEPEPTPEAAPAPAAEPSVADVDVTPSAPEPVPHAVRKRAYRPQPVVPDEPREVGFWASFMRAAAAFSQGPSK